MNVHFFSTKRDVTLEEASKIARLPSSTRTQHLGTFPDTSQGQTGDGYTRFSSPSGEAKWSVQPYLWCVGLAGFTDTQSILIHTATHGDAPDRHEETLVQYRDVTRRLLDESAHSAACDAVLFGGTRSAEGRGKHYSEQLTEAIANLIVDESRSLIRPLIVPPGPGDTFKSPLPKRVLATSNALFYFEPSKKERAADRCYRFG